MWTPACSGVTRRIFISSGGPKAHENSVESHVIPTKAGIQFLWGLDPRFRGGDVVTFISMGGPPAHVHSEWQLESVFPQRVKPRPSDSRLKMQERGKKPRRGFLWPTLGTSPEAHGHKKTTD